MIDDLNETARETVKIKLQEIADLLAETVGHEAAAVCLTSFGLGLAVGHVGSAGWSDDLIAKEAIVSLARVKADFSPENTRE